jgi:hypothetical protein
MRQTDNKLSVYIDSFQKKNKIKNNNNKNKNNILFYSHIKNLSLYTFIDLMSLYLDNSIICYFIIWQK